MIDSLSHVALRVVDRRVGEAFYGELGLLAQDNGDETLLSCPGRTEAQIRLVQGSGFGLNSFCLGAAGQSLLRIAAKVASHPSFSRVDGFEHAFEDLDGNLITLAATSNDAAEPRPWLYNNPGSPARLARRGVPSHLAEPPEPRRLVRLGLFSPDPMRLAQSYADALGLIIVARLDDRALYLGSATGGDHHLIELHRSDGAGLHHIALEVDNLDEIAIARRSMIASGRRPVSGMGRSVVNGELFLYGRDPWNGLVALVVDGAHFGPGARLERVLDGVDPLWALDGGPAPDFMRRWCFARDDDDAR